MTLNKKTPLVSVLCLCYNHAKFVRESLNSILKQSYKNIEIVIVNDKSSDNSNQVIEKWISNSSFKVTYINNSTNIGHTKSFNKALALSKGKYIVDLAADDTLTPNCLDNHINNFNSYPESNKIGISYSNVETINELGKHLKYHFKIDNNGKAIAKPKSGNIYSELLNSYYLNPTGMCVKKEVFEFLNGYDESLDYEDFDFWIRSSFVYDYIFCDTVGVQKRILDSSHSSQAMTNKKKQLKKDKSTYIVCKKAFLQNNSLEHHKAFLTRAIHEFKIVTKRYHLLLSFKYTLLYLVTRGKLFFIKEKNFN